MAEQQQALSLTVIFSTNKSELIIKIAEEAGISKAQANAALSSLVNSVTKTLKSGGKVTIVGLGTFSVSKRAARSGRNAAMLSIFNK